MSLTIAIPCSDRAVIAADSVATDHESGLIVGSVLKIYKLTYNSAFTVTGEGIIDNFNEYLVEMIQSIGDRSPVDIIEATNFVEAYINKQGWAEYRGDIKKSHLEIILVGYCITPKVYLIRSNRESQEQFCAVSGDLDNAEKLLEGVVSRDFSKNKVKSANKTVVQLLGKASASTPTTIGRPFVIWHIFPNYIYKLGQLDVNRLDSRYN